MVEQLLAAGADVDATNCDGQTALHYAHSTGVVVEKLLAAGAAVNKPDKRGWTALHYAADRGQNAVVERLLAGGADANATNCDGESALHWAASKGADVVVQMLLAAGCRNLADRGGQTALHVAQQQHTAQVAAVTQGLETAERMARVLALLRAPGVCACACVYG